MLRYLIGRVAQGLLVLLVLSFVIFLAVRLMPGGSSRVDFRGEYPTHVAYWDFLKNAVRGDFGRSYRTGLTVTEELASRYGNTMLLAAGGTLVAAVLGVALGVLAAVHRGSKLDELILVLSLLTVSIPMFFMALMLLLVFCLVLGWVPSMWDGSLQARVLPIVTLGLPAVGFVTRTARSAMLYALAQPYISAAHARGLPGGRITYIHALRNTAVPVLTALGVRFGELLAGTMLVENAFTVPGIGRLLVDSVSMRDYPMILGCVLALAVTFLVINILVDLLYTLVDPKIRLSHEEA